MANKMCPGCMYYFQMEGSLKAITEFFAAPPAIGRNFGLTGGVAPTTFKEGAWLIYVDKVDKKSSLFIRLKNGAFECYLANNGEEKMQSNLSWDFLEALPGNTWDWIQTGGQGERPQTFSEKLPKFAQSAYKRYAEAGTKGKALAVGAGAGAGYGLWRFFRRR